MTVLNMVQAINLALKQEMKKDKTVVLLGEDVGVDGGVFRVTEGLIEEFGKERVIDTPLAESGIVGVSIGMAAFGLKPVAEIQFEGFMPPAFDQLVSHAARLRNRTRGRITIPLVVRSPYGGGIKALEHHSDSPEAYYAHTPGLKVVIPSNPYDAKGLLVSAIRDPDPVIFFEPKKIYRAIKQEVPDEEYTIPIGKANVVKEGEDITVITFGSWVRNALEAAEKLTDVSVEVLDLRTISPLDEEAIINSVAKTGRCIIVHEAPRSFSVSSEVSAIINEHCLLDLKAPVKRLTGYDIIMPLPKLEDYNLPSSDKIVNGIRKVMSF
ncbi:MAG TPA: alpha-ketoacid dehydrogenase subunit beta [Candidatus Nanoarchaeia archaeon]|nr:alpha-ketoacid dehydrogenase subunit beta [Candidatus Nanoarchaeia archaeon]